MKRKIFNNAAARRRTVLKARHKQLLNRQKQFFNFIQAED